MEESENIPPKQTVENIPEVEHSEIPPSSGAAIIETTNTAKENEMEVHQHTHAHGKRNWISYFWEFLMLFLAVFCGFLAEYQLEHKIERDRETEYMQSMLNDLKQDTTEIKEQIKRINDYFKPVLKRSVELLYTADFSDSTIKQLYDTVPKSIRFFTLILQDNAATQLKNSGNLRLIRKKEVTDSLAKYWNLSNYLMNTLVAGYEATRINAKESVYSLFSFHYFEDNSLIKPLRKNISLKLLSADKVQYIKLGNLISNLNIQLTGTILTRLNEMNRKATDLIALIQKEYHLE